MTASMNRQVAGCGKIFQAHRTAVGLHSGMHGFVNFQVTGGRERFETIVAFVRLLTGVYALMNPQIIGPTK